MSSKGQVIVPKALRDSRKWKPGTRFQIEETRDGLLLRAEPLFPPTTLDQVVGILRHGGPPLAVEDMDRAIAEAVAEDWERFARD